MTYEFQEGQPLRVIGRDGMIRYVCVECLKFNPFVILEPDKWYDDMAYWAEHQVEVHDSE